MLKEHPTWDPSFKRWRPPRAVDRSAQRGGPSARLTCARLAHGWTELAMTRGSHHINRQIYPHGPPAGRRSDDLNQRDSVGKLITRGDITAGDQYVARPGKLKPGPGLLRGGATLCSPAEPAQSLGRVSPRGVSRLRQSFLKSPSEEYRHRAWVKRSTGCAGAGWGLCTVSLLSWSIKLCRIS